MDTGSGSFTVPVSINKNEIIFIFTENFFNDAQSDEVEKHCHSFYEIHYYLYGTGSLLVGDDAVIFGPGSLFIIPPETYHLQQIQGGQKVEKYIFKFSVPGNINPYDNILAPVLNLIDTGFCLFVKDIPEIRSILDAVRLEIAKKDKGYLLQISNGLSDMMILLARKCIPENGSIGAHGGQKDTVPTETAIIIDNFFDQNYNRNARFDDLCGMVHLSPSQLSRVLKAMYSMTFKEKHIQTRIFYIQHLLSKPGPSITEIAAKSGFDSVSGFSNFFRHNMGISPEKYRNRLRT